MLLINNYKKISKDELQLHIEIANKSIDAAISTLKTAIDEKVINEPDVQKNILTMLIKINEQFQGIVNELNNIHEQEIQKAKEVVNDKISKFNDAINNDNEYLKQYREV